MEKEFRYILNNYLDGTFKVDSATEIYRKLIRELPNQIEAYIGRNDIYVKGSMGQGNKTEYPWIAIMNKNITMTTQNGLYIVFLFRKDMSGFYLSLNQGITNFKNLYGKEQYINARKVANYFKTQIGESSFSQNDINLTCGDETKSLGYGYEQTNIISKYFPSEMLDGENIKNSINEMLFIYDEITEYLSVKSYSQVIKDVLAGETDAFMDADTAVEKIREVLDPHNEMPFGFNRKLLEVEPFIKKTKKYERITNPKSTKIDYIHKTKHDAEIGLLGEELVISFEKERLNKLMLEEYSEKIKWISKESDAFGYDIESYDIDKDGNVFPIKIEVKTTSSKVDNEFYVTKNELNVSKFYKNCYYIYRVYDVNSQFPKLYRVSGSIDQNFVLDPVTYMARYKKI